MTVLLNILFPLFALTIIGLPLVIWLIEKKDWALGLFISPILGLIFYSSINLFLITFFSTPFNPLYFFYIFLPCFIIFSVIKRKCLLEIIQFNANWIFFIIPAFAICFFSYLVDRPSFVSGGQDEIQYVNNSLFLLNHQNTGDSLDTVIPRIDHWLTDAITTTLTYSNNYRRGSELFLGLVIKLTGENPYVSFTYGCVIGYLIYLISVPIFFKHCFELSYKYCLFFQIVIASSYIWIMLSFQGSLANILSLPLIILPLIAYPKIINFRNYKKSILGGILISGPILFYSEIALILVIIPIALSAILNFIKNKNSSPKYALICFLTILCISHIGIYTLASNTYLNLLNSQVGSAFDIQARYFSQFVNHWSAIFGLFSYYSTYRFNDFISSFINTNFHTFAVIAFTLYVLAILGFIKYTKRNESSRPLLFAFILLVVVVLNSIIHDSVFISIRGTQYTYQFTIIGLILASVIFKNSLVRLLVFLLLIILLFVNTVSVIGSLNRFETITNDKDSLLIRYSPNFSNWSSFKSKLESLDAGTVLISGYKGTAKPHFLTSIIEPMGTVLGSDIQKFWKVYDIVTLHTKNFELNQLFNFYPKKQSFNNKSDLARLIDESKIAIIPEHDQDPIDWINTSSLITWERWRFSSIGDILNKNIKSNIHMYIDSRLIDKNTSPEIQIVESLNIDKKCPSDNTRVSYEFSFNEKIEWENITIEPLKSKIQILNNVISIDCGYGTSAILKINFKKPIVLRNVYVVQHQ